VVAAVFLALVLSAPSARASEDPAPATPPGLTILSVQIGPEDRLDRLPGFPDGSVPRGDTDYRAERVQPTLREWFLAGANLPRREDHGSLTRQGYYDWFPPFAVRRTHVVLKVGNDSSKTIDSVEWSVASRFDGDREVVYHQGPARLQMAPGAEAELVGFLPEANQRGVGPIFPRFHRVEYLDGTVWRAPAPLDVPEAGDLRILMDCVLPPGRCPPGDPLQVFQAFSRTADAPAAIPVLIQAIERADSLAAWPEVVVGNACLTLDLIAGDHPEADIPAEPLLEAVRRKDWRTRRHCARALGRALAPEVVNDRREEAVQALLPLLLSQRPPVFEAAAWSLERITGHSFGPDPERWRVYYEREYGRPLDVSDAFHEWVAAIDRLEGGVYRVDETEYADDRALAKGLREFRAFLEEQGLTLSVVVRATEREIARFTAGSNSLRHRGWLGRLVHRLWVENSLPVAFASPDEAFRPPHNLLKAVVSPSD
jgi:hypothetical protein